MGQRLDAYIGLGANVGPARDTLGRAVHLLGALPSVRRTGVSRLYATAPIGPVEQPDFLNAVVALEVPAGPTPAEGALALLGALKGLERAMGRVERERWGPRELDLDLLLYGDHALRVERDEAARSADPRRSGVQWLEVPHPEAAERAFVLAPLADLAAELVPPGWDRTVRAARDAPALATELASVRPIATWHDAAGTWPLPDGSRRGQHRT